MQWRFTGPAHIPITTYYFYSSPFSARDTVQGTTFREIPCFTPNIQYNPYSTIWFILPYSTTRRETWANQDNNENSSGEFHLASNLSFYDPNPFVSRMSILLLFQVTADPTTKRVQQNLLWKNYWYGTILLFIGSVHSTFHYPRRIFAGSSPLSCVIEEK